MKVISIDLSIFFKLTILWDKNKDVDISSFGDAINHLKFYKYDLDISDQIFYNHLTFLV